MDWLREKIGMAIGEASMCWSEAPHGVFESERAIKIMEDVCSQINECNRQQYPVIHGLDEAINYFENDGPDKEIPYAITWDIKMELILKAARAYAELQNREGTPR